MADSKKRSFLKAITWKLIGLAILPFIALMTLTDSASDTITVQAKSFLVLSVFYHATMFLLFFLHERVWDRIKWGKKR